MWERHGEDVGVNLEDGSKTSLRADGSENSSHMRSTESLDVTEEHVIDCKCVCCFSVFFLFVIYLSSHRL